MEFKVAGIVPESVVDGPGIRMAVFFQGCLHNCLGCHNPTTHDLSKGSSMLTENVIYQYKKNPLLDGITLTGGDPIYQPKAALEISREIKKLGGSVWLYTGFTIEELVRKNDIVRELLSTVDCIVDGPFEIDKRDLTLEWRGSSNQRILTREDIDKYLEEV